MFARHLPTQRFTQAAFNDMPVYPANYDGEIEGPVFVRFPDRRGYVVVGFAPSWDDDMPCYAVRPIVRVPYNREVA